MAGQLDDFNIDDQSLLRKLNLPDVTDRGAMGYQFDIRLPNREATKLDSIDNKSMAADSIKITAGSIKDQSYRNMHQ